MTDLCAVTTRTVVYGPQLWENACIVTESHAITSVLTNTARTRSCSACTDRDASFQPKLLEPPGLIASAIGATVERDPFGPEPILGLEIDL